MHLARRMGNGIRWSLVHGTSHNPQDRKSKVSLTCRSCDLAILVSSLEGSPLSSTFHSPYELVTMEEKVAPPIGDLSLAALFLLEWTWEV